MINFDPTSADQRLIGQRQMAVEEPKYTVVAKHGPFEIRDYPGTVVAEVEVDGDRQAATSAGFRLLAGYIFGGNAGAKSVAMTAPVAQTRTGAKIAMTAPVSLSGNADNWLVQFTMPSAYSLDDLPTPNDPRVRLRSVPPRRLAVAKFSGLTREPAVSRQTSKLQAFLGERGLSPTGTPILARYDPPWTPWFMRRNEVMLAVLREP
jgi:hypothetical protein